MKKLNVLLFVVLTCVIFSCKKKVEDVTPADNSKQSTETPHYDESNSSKVAWEDLPAELKNAKPIDTSSNARLEYAYYSYQLGPWGGGGGGGYSIYPPNGSRIYAIAVRSGSLVDAITIWYVTPQGTIYYGGSAGGGGGGYYVQYFSADEYIYAINGRSGKYVDRLSFFTNRKSFTYGGNGGSPFYASVGAGYQILGFFGGAGGYVDRIGFWVYTR